MKRVYSIILPLLALLCLVACSGGQTEQATGSGQTVGPVIAPIQTMTEKAKDSLAAQGFEVVDGEVPMESVEELLAAARNIERYGGGGISEQWAATGVPNPEDLTALENGGTEVPFSDEPWEKKTVEVMDITKNMTAAEKAEWEEFQNTDWTEMTDGLEEMVAGFQDMGDGESFPGDSEDIPDDMGEIDMDDLQNQIDQALENAEIPEGYEPYLPDNIDIGALLGGG